MECQGFNLCFFVRCLFYFIFYAMEQVQTPNKRRLGDVERVQESEADDTGDLLEDLAFNPSDAPVSDTEVRPVC